MNWWFWNTAPGREFLAWLASGEPLLSPEDNAILMGVKGES